MHRIFRSPLCALFVLLLAAPALAQSPLSTADARYSVLAHGAPHDWSHRHLIFSNSADPADPSVADAAQRDPRFWQQAYRRHDIRFFDFDPPRDRAPIDPRRDRRFEGVPLDPDWNEAMNTGALAFTVSKFPAKYSFNTSGSAASCTNDFVVFALGSNSPTSFNLVAFSNLYLNTANGSAFCSGGAPTLLFSYFVSTGGLINAGPINGSPSLSLDGSQIAFVESAGGTITLGPGGIFHVLKWQAATSTPTFPGTTGTVGNCATSNVAPCEYSLSYANGNTATRTSPFIDYATDTAYVTDNSGNVYAISPVFGGGAPAVKSGWPVSTKNGNTLTAPVYDSVSQRVFVTDSSGKLYALSTSAACGVTPAPCLIGSVSVSAGTINDSPIVDSSSEHVFVFSNSAPTGSGVTGAAVVQTDINLANVVVAGIGGGSKNLIWAGDFNNAYYSNGAGSTGATLYACGDDSTADAPVLFSFGFNSSGKLSATPTGSGLFLSGSNTAAAACSPLTETYNSGTNNDRIFAGLSTNCASGETTGCIISYDITAGFPTTFSSHLAESGGTSGIIADYFTDINFKNITTDVYFLTAGTQTCSKYSGGTQAGQACAISATQKALQ